MTITPTDQELSDLPLYERRSRQWQRADHFEQKARYAKGCILRKIKSEMGQTERARFHKEHGISKQEAYRLSKWADLCDSQGVAESATLETNISAYTAEKLVAATPNVQQAVIEHVTETNETLTAAEVKRVQDLAVEVAQENTDLQDQVDRLKAELKAAKEQKKQSKDLGPDPADSRLRLARDHERAMNMGAGTQRQELTRYFEYRDLYTEEGRKFMDGVVKNTFLVLKANLSPTGDPLEPHD